MTRLLLFALLVATSATAVAQPAPGTIGVYFDAAGTVDRSDVPTYVPVNFYVIAFDPPAGIESYEFELVGFNQTAFVLESSTPGVNEEGLAPTQFRVEADACLADDVVVLATITVLYVSPPPPDTAICVRAIGQSAAPTYRDCNGDAQTFAAAQHSNSAYPDGCAIVNPSLEIFCCYDNVYELGMPEVLAPVGDVRRIPLVSDVWQDFYCVGSAVPRTTCLPGESYRIRRDLAFDPALLRLVGAELADEVVGWTLTLTDVEPGRVTVDAFSPDRQDPWPDLDFGAHIWFEFEVLAPGTATIVFGPDTDDPVFGAITQDPVSDRRSSFGALKMQVGQ